jgi:hypothetical protein
VCCVYRFLIDPNLGIGRGATGVAPVKFGVAPNFVRDSIIVLRQSLAARAPQTLSGATPEATGRRPVPPESTSREFVVSHTGKVYFKPAKVAAIRNPAAMSPPKKI